MSGIPENTPTNGRAEAPDLSDAQRQEAVERAPKPDGLVIPAGMQPWHGGDSAPADWDGGPVAFRGHAQCAVYAGQVGNAKRFNGERWNHTSQKHLYVARAYDIIAYTPVTPASSERREAIARIIYAAHPSCEGHQFSGPYLRTFDDARLRGFREVASAYCLAGEIIDLLGEQ